MIITKYQNGGYSVEIQSDGTKIRSGNSTPIFPESIDVKITNYCDMGCPYCHETSTKKGLHGDLSALVEAISEIPPGVELAIGGGNPLSHPEIVDFLHSLRHKGLIANLTVNQGHLKRFEGLLDYLISENLVKGIGVSIVHENMKYVGELAKKSPHVVAHVIAGINTPNVVDVLVSCGVSKVLILGYKTYGMGIKFHSPEVDRVKTLWRQQVRGLFDKCTLSFDNLAIEQLEIKKWFTQKGWDKFYMGDDFCFTMYIDAVNQEFAPTSRSKERVKWGEMSLLDFFGRKPVPVSS